MPTEGMYDYCVPRLEIERIRAWKHHYLTKGCSERKAGECARRKWRTQTWPPK